MDTRAPGSSLELLRSMRGTSSDPGEGTVEHFETPPESDLERLRRVTTDALLEHFASEHLTLDEFDRRIALIRDASDGPELRGALEGLPGEGGTGSAGAFPTPSRRPGSASSNGLRALRTFAFLGRSVVDVAPDLGPGRSDVVVPVHVIALFGTVEVHVPRDSCVVVAGRAGAVTVDARLATGVGSESRGPTVRVRTFGLGGRVLVRPTEGEEPEEEGADS